MDPVISDQTRMGDRRPDRTRVEAQQPEDKPEGYQSTDESLLEAKTSTKGQVSFLEVTNSPVTNSQGGAKVGANTTNSQNLKNKIQNKKIRNTSSKHHIHTEVDEPDSSTTAGESDAEELRGDTDSEAHTSETEAYTCSPLKPNFAPKLSVVGTRALDRLKRIKSNLKRSVTSVVNRVEQRERRSEQSSYTKRNHSFNENWDAFNENTDTNSFAGNTNRTNTSLRDSDNDTSDNHTSTTFCAFFTPKKGVTGQSARSDTRSDSTVDSGRTQQSFLASQSPGSESSSSKSSSSSSNSRNTSTTGTTSTAVGAVGSPVSSGANPCYLPLVLQNQCLTVNDLRNQFLKNHFRGILEEAKLISNIVLKMSVSREFHVEIVNHANVEYRFGGEWFECGQWKNVDQKKAVVVRATDETKPGRLNLVFENASWVRGKLIL
jgi:hypothetical protein